MTTDNQGNVNLVKRAVDRLGGPTKASIHFGVSNGSIHAWMKAGRIPNIDYAKKMSELTGIEVEELRPLKA